MGSITIRQNCEHFFLSNTRSSPKSKFKRGSEESYCHKIPSIEGIFLHIKCAYLQTHTWLHLAFMESIEVNYLEYSYELEDDNKKQITPKIIEEN